MPPQPAGPSGAGPEPYQAWAGAAADALQRWYSPRKGLWKTTGWWNSANVLTALIGYCQRTGEHPYRDVIETTFGRAGRVTPGFTNEYYDDDGWWALAWIAAFDLTGEVRYLDMARSLFEGMAAGWDDACGGGVWWTRAKTYKNAIPNELFLLIAARLHQRATGDGRYLDWALRQWEWFSASGLIGPAGLVNDGLTADCANNGGTTWTYNQGVIVGGLTALHEITGDAAHLAQAEAIAGAALRDLTVPPGVLAEPVVQPGRGAGADVPQFKGIFMRNMQELYRHRPRARYREFFLANATSLWHNSRNHRNQFGLVWTGPFDCADAARQASALDAFNAAAGAVLVWQAGLSPSSARRWRRYSRWLVPSVSHTSARYGRIVPFASPAFHDRDRSAPVFRHETVTIMKEAIPRAGPVRSWRRRALNQTGCADASFPHERGRPESTPWPAPRRDELSLYPRTAQSPGGRGCANGRVTPTWGRLGCRAKVITTRSCASGLTCQWS